MKKKISPMIAFVLGMVTAFSLELGYNIIRRFIPPEGDEIARITSPDGRVDAVTLAVSPGSLGSYQYNLYLVNRGAKVKSVAQFANMQTSEGDNPRALWIAPHFLSVDPGNAHVEFFDNSWYSDSLNYNVELDYNQSASRHYLQPNGCLHGLPCR